MTPCNKINKSLVVYRCSGNVITYVTTLHLYLQNFDIFMPEMRFQSNLNDI